MSLTADYDALAIPIRTALVAAIPGPMLNGKAAGHTPTTTDADGEHTRFELDFGVPQQLGVFGDGSLETAIVTLTSWTRDPASTYREQVHAAARQLVRDGIPQWPGLLAEPQLTLDPPRDDVYGPWLWRETQITITLEVNLDD